MSSPARQARNQVDATPLDETRSASVGYMCSATRALTTGPMHVTNAATSKKPRFAVAVTNKPCGLRPVSRSLPTPQIVRKSQIH